MIADVIRAVLNLMRAAGTVVIVGAFLFTAHGIYRDLKKFREERRRKK